MIELDSFMRADAEVGFLANVVGQLPLFRVDGDIDQKIWTTCSIS